MAINSSSSQRLRRRPLLAAAALAPFLAAAPAPAIADGDSRGTIERRRSPQRGADLRLRLYSREPARGVQLTLLGRIEGSVDEAPVFQIETRADGSLWWFDGLEQDSLGWTQFGAADAVATGRWNTVIVQVSRRMERALIYAADDPGKRPRPHELVGAVGPVGVSAVESITGFQIASGDSVVIDDVTFADGRHVAKAPRERTFHVGDPVTVDSTDDGFMQMPNTATVHVTADGRQEVLVGYPVHGDATHDTGTALAASTDEGRSWTQVDERNPFPEEQSFYLSTLNSGELLAVSYHTFMVEGSGDTEAIVPTAVSSDGGRSWTHREGTMTAPTAMRPISDGTSRPGHELGGFVLVHSVKEIDGTLFQSGYGYYEGDERYRQILLASSDGGITWEVRGTIAVDPDLSDHPRYEGFSEAAIAQTRDGNLLAVMRTGNYQPLYQATSIDGGRTWNDLRPVVAGPDEIPVVGVFPDLLPMPDGTMVLWIGRPGQSLLASPDGNGHSWTTPVTVDYMNSGNGTLVPLGGSRILAFGDRGADWTPKVPERKEIWASEARLML
ncbi:sialidase family protein [Brachybacterium sacelli]|uniref:Sialidase domain-containing protein n=1 Tax=Brachybacterium sacelli TaxID=173364 RepID=A0ABS4WWC6_9MICO|nr:sialidase family protein [Brachybacterium sacelli]MBP2380509.1 hypothetical protein [Brachybacterium sacelli]